MPNRAAELRQSILARRPDAILAERGTHFLKHRVNIAGSPTRQFIWTGSIGALHFQNHAKEWVEIDDVLVSDSGGGYIRKTQQAPYFMRIHRSGARRIYPDAEDLSRYIQFGGMAGLGPPSFPGNSVHWGSPQHFEVDIIPHGSAVKLAIKIKERGAPHKFTFTMQLVGLRRWGRFIFPDDGDEPVLEIRQPVAMDIDEMTKDVGLSFVGNTVQLTLDDEGMRYPITIDPTVDRSIGASGDDGFGLNGGFDSTNSQVNIGRLSTTSWRSFLRFLNVAVPNAATISSAYIQFTSRGTLSGATCNQDISLEDTDSAAQIADASDWDGRSKTAAVDWDDIPPWSWLEKSEDTKSPSIVTPVQTVINRADWASGNAMQVFLDDDASSNYARRYAFSYDGDSGKSCDLYIEYQEAAVTVEAALAAEGTMTPKAVLSPGLLKASLSGDGGLTCVASVGALHLIQAALSGDGGLTAKGVLAPMLARANLDAEGSLTAVAVRTRTVAAAFAAEGGLTARAEIGNILEAAASFSAEGTLVAVAKRDRAVAAALSAEGTMVANAVFAPGLMKAALSAEGTLTVIADVGVPITEPMTETTWEIDPAHYPSGTTFELVVGVEASASGVWGAYLYNVTLGSVVVGSGVFSTASGKARVESSPFNLDSGPNVYRVHYGGTVGVTYTPHGAALRVHAEP